MGRPVKNTVEYFSHDTDACQGHTLEILMNCFGHEGISAWWQLLERLGDSENHFIDIRNSEDLEYLAAKMKFQPERLMQILKKMTALGAIDKKMLDYGIIWCQHFVDRLESVYKKRGLPLPVKPTVLTSQKAFPLAETPLLLAETPLLLAEKHNSIVKESKVEDSILEKSTDSASSSNNSVSLRDIVKVFEDCGGAVITPMIAQLLADVDREYGSEIVIAAFRKASGNGKKGVNLLNYCRPIFEQYKAEGLPAAKEINKGAHYKSSGYKLPPPGLMEDN